MIDVKKAVKTANSFAALLIAAVSVNTIISAIEGKYSNFDRYFAMGSAIVAIIAALADIAYTCIKKKNETT